MSANLYFRIRDNGAQVFRVVQEARDRRMTLDPLATVVLRSGEIRVQGERVLTDEESSEIAAWMEERRETLQRREIDDMRRTMESMQAAAQWIQSRAKDDAIREVADDLLMALHDLRSATVRRLANLD